VRGAGVFVDDQFGALGAWLNRVGIDLYDNRARLTRHIESDSKALVGAVEFDLSDCAMASELVINKRSES
jgi:hypothetical protein